MQNEISPFRFNEYLARINGLSLRIYLSHSKNPPADPVHKYFPMHTHTFIEAFACFEGDVCIKTEKKDYLLQAGDLLLVPSGCPHFCESQSTDQNRFIAFGYLGTSDESPEGFDLYTALFPLLFPADVLLFRGIRTLEEQLSPLLRYVAAERNIPYPALILALLLDSLLPHLQNCKNENKSLQNDEISSKDANRLSLFHELLISRYNEPLSVNEIAKLLYMSPRQLERVVKRHYGSSVRALFLERRLTLAEKMLRETNRTVEEVAIAVGFGDAASFSRAFAGTYGMSPGRYRKS